MVLLAVSATTTITTTTTATTYYSYNYTTQHYSTLIVLHYTPLHSIPLHSLHYTYKYKHNHNYNYATLQYITLDYTALHYPALHYTRPITPLQYNCNYTALITLHHSYNPTTLQLQLQLHYATVHPAVVVEVNTATTLTTATTPKKTAPTTFRSISGVCRSANQDSQQPTFPIGFLY